MGARISLYVNGSLQDEQVDGIPFMGADHSRIGIRCYTTTVDIQTLDIFHMGLPEKTTPLAIGDYLMSKGHVADAIGSYLEVAGDRRRGRLAEDALLRAWMASRAVDDTTCRPWADSAEAALARRFPRSAHWRTINEGRIARVWQEKKYDEAFERLREHYARYPESRIALQLALPAGIGSKEDSIKIARRLLGQAAVSGKIAALSLAGLNLTSLDHFRNLRLTRLDCAQNEIASLEPLRGMPLKWLSVNQNEIASLAPLRNQPLLYLSCADNLIHDLGPLAGSPLQSLQAQHNGITDISPLRKCPLKVLSLADNHLSDLSPLADLRLVRLTVERNCVSDLSPLRGHPLRALSLTGNRISSLEPLAGVPLNTLEFRSNNVADLSVLRGMPLEHLWLDNNPVSSIEPLRGLTLNYLGARDCPVTDLGQLRGMSSLHTLNVEHTPVADFSPLEGLPLQVLYCGGTAVADLGFTRALPELHTLRVHGTGLRSLSALSAPRLRDLSCAQTAISDLSPLRKLPIERLNVDNCPLKSLASLGPLALTGLLCSSTGISTLEPLNCTKLIALECDSNSICSLEPLAAAPLERLSCKANQITDLGPLAAKKLTELNCQDNHLTRLEPFYADPPNRFLFFSRSLSPEEFDRAVEAWGANPAWAHHSRTARAFTRIARSDYAGLGMLALPFDGHSYLPLSWELPFDEADSICRRACGHLATVDSPEEAHFLLKFAREANGQWLGIMPDSLGTLRSLTGGTVDPRIAHRTYDPRHRMRLSGEGYNARPGYIPSCFVIEWEQ